MRVRIPVPAVVLAVLLGSAVLAAAQHPPQTAERLAEVNRRGASMMGFDQENTTHQFHVTSTGGVIEVQANDPGDADTIRRVQRHLSEIAKEFGRGDFVRPALIHDQEVPGTETMKKLKDEIRYRFRKSPQGGRVEIFTADLDALRAIHEFLRFQTHDHQTGESKPGDGKPTGPLHQHQH